MKNTQRRFKIAATSAFLVLVFATCGAAKAGTEIGWDGESYIRNQELGYNIQFGGRVFNDVMSVSADDGVRETYPGITDGTEVRSARFFTQGFVHHVVDYKLQFEFAGQMVGFRDAYLGLRKLPVVGTIRIGNQKEMFGLEQLMSLKRIAFVERSLTSALSPGRNIGLGMGKTVSGGKVSITGGVFRNSSEGTSYSGNKRNATLRFTIAPRMDTEYGKILHLGVAGSLRQAERDPEDGKTKLRYASQPESNLLPQLIDTGFFEADAAAHIDGEIAAIWRNVLLQAEYVYAATDAAASGDPVFSAYYVYGSYFITGESRGYRGGVVQGIKPKSGYDGKGGKGAWEVALRYSGVDLNDKNVHGGEEQNITAALNWYLSEQTRFMINYTYADIVDVGTAQQVIARFQVVF